METMSDQQQQRRAAVERQAEKRFIESLRRIHADKTVVDAARRGASKKS